MRGGLQTRRKTPESAPMLKRWGWLAAAAGAVWLAACTKTDDGLTQRLLDANDKVLACQKDLAGAKTEVAGLKRQLAQAVANPARIQLQDPEIIQLVADLRGPPAGDRPVAAGALDPQKASGVVMQGARAMQACYERALKKNASLQQRAGIGVTLAITVQPSGSVDTLDISPDVDKEMTECIRSAAGHWKFPPFSGKAVTIEQKLTLTPKT
jgi:hypothetical protein